MSLLISILILALVISCAIWLVDMLPLPPPGKMAARVILSLVALVWLLRMLGVWSGRVGAGLG